MDHSSSSVLVVATRFHLGKAAVPPSPQDLQSKLQSFARFCSDSCGGSSGSAAVLGVIAVDAEERIPGYNLVTQMEEAVAALLLLQQEQQSTVVPLHILPVQPWNQFCPALNALISWACTSDPVTAMMPSSSRDGDGAQILFCSAETTASPATIAALRQHMTDPDTLVTGLVLPGHDYSERGGVQALTGRTTPWNTLALWNLRLLALTGFQLVSEGLIHDKDSQANPDDDATDISMAGVEEVVAIAVLQRLLGAEHAKAKLIQLNNKDTTSTSSSGGVTWDQAFGGDPARQKWHEQKMQSKISRAARQLQLLGGLTGTVHHC